MNGQTVRFIHSDSHRACVGCATAKTKCCPSSDGTTACERCQRLKKECVIVPRPDRKRKRQSSTRQAGLEDKVDEIVALLKDKDKDKDKDSQQPDTKRPQKAPPPKDLTGLGKLATPPVSITPKPAPTPTSIQDLGISDSECEEALGKFLTDQSVHCPWISIPKGTTAVSLREQKPLLFMAIMLAASYHDLEVQQRIAKISLHFISDQLIIHGNKSMALLQGMLVLLNWYQSQFLNPQATVTNLLHLSIALTTDLGLNQNPASLANQRLLHSSLMGFMNGNRKGPAGAGGMPGMMPGVTAKTLDDRRALLGCFYIVMGITFHSSPTFSHAMGWSPQLEEAAIMLTESGLAGNHTDLRLAKMARLQQIVAEIDHLQRELTLANKPLASLSLYIQPFEARLEQYWAEMPSDFRQDNSFLLAYHAAYRNLYKISLLDIGKQSHSLAAVPNEPSNSTSASTPSTATAVPSAESTLSTIALHETRHRCLRSAIDCMNCFFAVPPAKLFAMPLVFYAQVGLAMITLARLKFSVPSPWTPDLPPMHEILERLARNLDQAMDAVSREEGKDVRNNRLAQWAAWVRILEGAVTAGLDGVGAGLGAEDVTVVGDGDTTVPTGLPGGISAAMAAAAAAGMNGSTAAMMSGMFATPPLEGMVPGADPSAMGMSADAEIMMETDWSALLDDMCGYGLFGYSDDGTLQGVLNDGFDGIVVPPM